MNTQELMHRINYLTKKLGEAHIEASGLYAQTQTLEHQLSETNKELTAVKEELKNVEQEKTNQ